jgi:hypothetical protein
VYPYIHEGARGSGRNAPFNFTRGTRQRREVSSTPHPLYLGRNRPPPPPVAGGPQGRPGRSGEGNTLLPLHRGAASSPVTIPPELSKLIRNTQATLCKSTSVVYRAASHCLAGLICQAHTCHYSCVLAPQFLCGRHRRRVRG